MPTRFRTTLAASIVLSLLAMQSSSAQTSARPIRGTAGQ